MDTIIEHRLNQLLKSKNPYTFFDTLCFRTPLLPLEFYNLVFTDKEISKEKYREIWKNPAIKEAVFLASPELYNALQKWATSRNIDSKSEKRLRYSLLKYLSRISARCTPFGLFAGCATASFGSETNISLDTIHAYARQTRLDMHFLVELVQHLVKIDQIKSQILWYPNSSLYQIGNQYRYVEYTYIKQNKRAYTIEAVMASSYLENILAKSQSGASVGVLSEILIDDDITKEEATDFIHELIDNQVLVSELEPSICGDNFLKQLLGLLHTLHNITDVTHTIKELKNKLLQLDMTIGNSITYYKEFIELAEKLETPMDKKYLLQTDLYPVAISSTLDRKWGYHIRRMLPLLNKISISQKDTNLSHFKNAFLKRYETREVPLTTVLDTEIGIGYLQGQEASDSTPFLEGLDIPYQEESIPQSLSWGTPYNILHKKLEQTIASNAVVMEINDADFESLPVRWDDLPDTMAAMAEVILQDGKEKMVLSSIGGTSATNLLARFTHGNKAIQKQVHYIADIEQQMNPDHILAEIIHLPESRIGNVIQRVSLRDYEIPYLGKSNLSREQQIAITDLMISLRHNQIQLRSKRLDKRVLPRLSNAHNYSANALPIYHFLCDLQKQELRASIGFYWGAVLEKRKFLPRVVYKDFILSKARWLLTQKDIEIFLPLTKDPLIDAISSWRAALCMPKLVQLVEGDNTLLINLENYDMIQMWLDTVKKIEIFVLEEFLFTEESVIKGENKGFTNQFVISFYNEEKLKQAKERAPHLSDKNT